MKFDSPLFDRIRVKPAEDRRPHLGYPACDWPGCREDATHRAPKGRLRAGEYWRFCLDHVREDAIARYQKEAVTGHRPTWKIGVNGKRAPAGAPQNERWQFFADDPFELFQDTGVSRFQSARTPSNGRVVRNAERKALDVLGLEPSATSADIKARFKVLVKRHHPDANGGDRSCEDQLRDIIQAYNYLKSVGWC